MLYTQISKEIGHLANLSNSSSDQKTVTFFPKKRDWFYVFQEAWFRCIVLRVSYDFGHVIRSLSNGKTEKINTQVTREYEHVPMMHI